MFVYKFLIGFVILLIVSGFNNPNDSIDPISKSVFSFAGAESGNSNVENLGNLSSSSMQGAQNFLSTILTYDTLPVVDRAAVTNPLTNQKSAETGKVLQDSISSALKYSSPSEIIGIIRSFAPNGEILNIDVSADGKGVVFESSASNIVRGDTNQTTDVFLLLAEHRLLKRISVDSLGDQVVGNSVNPRISSDGGWVVYESNAKGLDPRDKNQFRDVYLYEIGTGRTSLISVALDGMAGNRDSGKPVVSRNADVISFESEATNLVENDENRTTDVFAYDKQLQSIWVVSKPVLDKDTDANQGNLASYNPDLSDDGHFLAFESFSSNLALDDNNNRSDVFLHNFVNQTTVLVSKEGSKGAVVSGDSTNPSVSGDGKYVVFQSQAQFFKSDLNQVDDSYFYDVAKKKLIRLPAEELYADKSVHLVGSYKPVISGDGSTVVYVIKSSAIKTVENQSGYKSHLAYYQVDNQASGELELFEFNEKNDTILDFSVSLSSGAEVLAFHVSRMQDALSGQISPKSGWLAKKQDIN